MRYHHTKSKGDLGVLYAKVDLAEKGFQILMPLTEHSPFDLVAYRDGAFVRVQVKYRAAKNGVIPLDFKSTWSDRHGIHKATMDKSEVDVVIVYCPDTRTCYYIDPRKHASGVQLRLAASRNNQVKGVLFADHFREMPVFTFSGAA